MISVGLIILAVTAALGVSLKLSRKAGPTTLYIIPAAVYGICFALSLVMLIGNSTDQMFSIIGASSGYSDFNINFALTASRFSAAILSLATLIAICISVFRAEPKSGADSNAGASLLAFSLFAISGIALSGNLLTILLFSVATGIISYAHLQREQKRLYLFKVLTLNIISDLALLAGIILIYSATRSFGFENIKSAIDAGILSGPLLIISGACFLLGSISKAAVFPFQIWLTTNEEISAKTESIFISLLALPAGIALALQLSQFFAPALMYAMVFTGAASLIYGLISSSLKQSLRDMIRHSAIAHAGLMFIAIGTGNSGLAIFMLGGVTVSRLALWQSLQLLDSKDGEKQNALYYWIFFASAIAFAGMPFSSLFISYEGLIKSSLFLNYDLEATNAVLTALAILVCMITAYNIFRFVFRADYSKFNSFSVSALKNPAAYAGIVMLLVFSFFAWYCISPYEISFLWPLAYVNLPNAVTQALPQPGFFQFLDTFLALISIAAGIMAAYFIKSNNPLNAFKSSKVNSMELYIDNFFAKYLIDRQKPEQDDSALTVSKLFAGSLRLDEPGTYISFSLLLIVIFYFIFRSM